MKKMWGTDVRDLRPSVIIQRARDEGDFRL